MDDRTVTGRVMAILEMVADLGDAATLANLTRRTGIPKPTVRRIAADLVDRGMLERHDRTYHLGPRLRELGARATAHDVVHQAAIPHVQDLFARSGEIAWLLAFTESTNLHFHAVFGPNRQSDMRQPWPTHIRSERFLSSAAGRILMANQPALIDELRRRPLARPTPYSPAGWPQLTAAIQTAHDNGYAVEREQSMLGYHCIASGIRDRNGRIVATVGILGRTSFALQRLTRPLLAAASDIEHSVRHP